METVKYITLDINKKYYEAILAKQGDVSSRFIQFQLLDNSTYCNLTNNTVKLFAKKSDGTIVFTAGEIISATEGKVKVELTSQTLALVGNVDCELVIYSADNKKLSTITFVVSVLAKINDDAAVESANEFTALTDALSVVTGIENKAEQTYVDQNFTEINSQLADIVHNVKTFGVKGDGVTDDTTAIQNAINYCQDNGYKLFFPVGIYLVSTTLTINKRLIIEGVDNYPDYFAKLYSNAPSYYPVRDNASVIKIKTAGSSNITIFNITSTTDKAVVKIKNLTLDGNDGDITDTSSNAQVAGTQDVALNFTGINVNGIVSAVFTELENIHFSGFSGTALQTGTYNTIRNIRVIKCNHTIVNSSADNTLSNLVVQNCNYGIEVSNNNITRLTDIRIEWIFLGYGISLNTSSNVVLSSIHIDRVYKAAIKLASCFSVIGSAISISRSGVYNRGANVATVGTDYDNSSGIYVGSGNRYINLQVNIIRNNSRDDSSGLNAPTLGFVLYNSQDIIINGMVQNFDSANTTSKELTQSAINNYKYISSTYEQQKNSTGGLMFTRDSDTNYRYDASVVFYNTLTMSSTSKFTLTNSATAPTSPSNGTMYYDTASNTFKIFISGAWKTVTVS